LKKNPSPYQAVNGTLWLTRQLTMEGWSLEAEDANEGQKLTSSDASSSLARETTETPCRFDVLLGRGKKYTGHPGNERLHTVVNMHSVRYSCATSRHKKTAIIQEIVQIIQSTGEPAGRFLKYEKAAGGWVEVDVAVARIKVSQAIQYTLRYKKRKALLEAVETSSAESTTALRSDYASRRGTLRGAHQQERSSGRNSLVSDESILAGLGYDIHSLPNYYD
jgi:hypothetical protein